MHQTNGQRIEQKKKKKDYAHKNIEKKQEAKVIDDFNTHLTLRY